MRLAPPARPTPYAAERALDAPRPARRRVVTAPAMRRARRHGGLWSRLRALPRRHPFLLALVALGLLLAAWGGYRANAAHAAYGDTYADARALRVYADRDPASLTSEDLRAIELSAARLDDDLARLDGATALPFGSGLVERIPWLGPRYAAGRDAIALGRLLAPAGAQGARVGERILAAFEQTGVEGGDGAPTWLDALLADEGELRAIAARVDAAHALRQSIAVEQLPAGAQALLADLDRLLARVDTGELLADLPALEAALGAERPVRYLVLFPNPAELRPAGGFPGDIALVEVERGQLRAYQFSGVSPLAEAYIAGRASKVPLPWPYEQYFRTDGFQIQDVVWSPDFTKVGAQFMAMYAETGWPPIDGIVAVQPSVASDLLRLVGPTLVITVDGEARTITPENLYDEIERQRRLRLSGIQATYHKDVMETIGAAIVERLKTADRATLVATARALRAAAERRDLQVYAIDAALQTWLGEQGWTGSMTPDPTTPTIAVAFGDLVAHKGALRMQPRIELTVGPSVDGRREARLDIYLQHTGTVAEGEFYSGFQRWWVEVFLPDGAERTASHDTPQPDPAAPNGGSYLIEIFPQQTGYVSVSFTLPDTPNLLVRRQPGVTPAALTVSQGSCAPPLRATLTADVVLPLDPGCQSAAH